MGATGPAIILADDGSASASANSAAEADHAATRYPRHRLGISALALDTSTHLEGKLAPEGILYSGGRDGLVISHDLGLPMKMRGPKVSTPEDGYDSSEQQTRLRMNGGRWEIMTGWGDDVHGGIGGGLDDDLDEAEERPTSGGDGDVLGDVVSGTKRRKRRIRQSESWKYYEMWELDRETFQERTVSSYYL